MHGRRATIADALTQLASFGMELEELVATAREMQAVVKRRWEQICRGNRFTALELDWLQRSFIAFDEPIANP